MKLSKTESIDAITSSAQISREAFVEKALRAYIAELRSEKIRKENNAFLQQQETLLENYRDQYVAIHNGQVIDHDLDVRELHLRVFKRLGYTPVLLKQVTERPERELVFRMRPYLAKSQGADRVGGKPW